MPRWGWRGRRGRVLRSGDVMAQKRYPIVSLNTIAAGTRTSATILQGASYSSSSLTDLSQNLVPVGSTVKAVHLDMTLVNGSTSGNGLEAYWAIVKNPSLKFAGVDLDPQTITNALGPYVIHRGMAASDITQLSAVGMKESMPYHFSGWVRLRRHSKIAVDDAILIIFKPTVGIWSLKAAVTFKFR